MTAHRTAPLVPVADIIASLAAAAKPLDPRRIALDEAVGGVLADPLIVEAPAPPQAKALRPGYAVASCKLVGASAYAPVMIADLPPWVDAGAALPPGTDAVLPPDAIAQHGPYTEIVAEVSPGENVCRAGDDAPPGAVLREAGEVLCLRHVAAARSAGLTHATVRSPRICVVGDRSLATEAALRFAKLEGIATISGMHAHLERDGAPVDVLILLTDDMAEAGRVLDQADRIIARGIALRPGETTQVALFGATPTVILPPRLDVLFAVSHCIVRPIIRHIARGNPDRVRRCGPLTRKLSSTIGFTEVALLQDTAQEVEPLGIGRLSLPALARAQYWLALPPESEGHQAGDMVDACEA